MLAVFENSLSRFDFDIDTMLPNVDVKSVVVVVVVVVVVIVSQFYSHQSSQMLVVDKVHKL